MNMQSMSKNNSIYKKKKCFYQWGELEIYFCFDYKLDINILFVVYTQSFNNRFINDKTKYISSLYDMIHKLRNFYMNEVILFLDDHYVWFRSSIFKHK
jgi:hypothetical protein